LKAVELFTGAGGLALGISAAGFSHEAVIERDRHACNTIRENQNRGFFDCPLYETDIRNFDYSSITGNIDLLAGGPPCQPFSLGGKHAGSADSRDMFPEAARALRELTPRVFMFENVKGLLRQTFAQYFHYIILQFTYPDLTRGFDEDWQEHHRRLKKYHAVGSGGGLSYRVRYQLFQACNYGVPQKRERVIIVGFRDDVDAEWDFPKSTHSMDALLYSQWVSGDYWEKHNFPARSIPAMPNRHKSRINKLKSSIFAPEEEPLATVRDALFDLPEPGEVDRNDCMFHNHYFNPGARKYSGHTGSPLDEPAKALKAGDHGVPGGENMLVYLNGKVRYFSVREAARLQTFPDEYILSGSWTENMRQIGNAVPVKLSQLVANSIKESLERIHLLEMVS